MATPIDSIQNSQDPPLGVDPVTIEQAPPPRAVASCWICHGTTKPLLYDVCDCKGSLGGVHPHCIDEWVFRQMKDHCSSCGKSYAVLTSYRRGAPPAPNNNLSRLVFALRYFYAPFCSIVLVSVTIGFIRFLLIPLLLGVLYYSTGVEGEPLLNRLGVALGAASSEVDLVSRYGILECIVVGMIPLLGFRTALTNHATFLKYFEKASNPNDEEFVVRRDDGFGDKDGDSPEERRKVGLREAEELLRQAESRDGLDEKIGEPEGREQEGAGSSGDSADAAEASQDHHQHVGFDEDENELDAATGPAAVTDETLAAEQDLQNFLQRLEAEPNPQGNDPNRNPKETDAFTTVELLMRSARKLLYFFDVPKTLSDLRRWMLEVVLAAVFVSGVKYFSTWTLVGLFIYFSIWWRWVLPPQLIPKEQSHLRLQIAKERRVTTPKAAIHIFFFTYALDIAMFSGVLPVLMGLTMHYGYTGFAVDTDFANYTPTGLSLAMHWFAGACLLIFLVKLEGNIMMALFAPGIDFFLLRSIDISNIVDSWGWIHAQLIGVDPLKICFDFLRIGTVELLAIVLFVRTPFYLAGLLLGEPFEPLPWFLEETWKNVLCTALALLLLATWVVFLAEYSLRRPILTVLRPICRGLGNLFGLERYLFDEEKWSLVGEWLARPQVVSEEGDDLVLVDPPLERMLVRRETWLGLEGYKPRFLRLRVFAFCVLFYASAAFIPTMTFVFVVVMGQFFIPTLPLLVTTALALPLLFVSPLNFLLSILRVLVTLGFFLVVFVLSPIVEAVYNLIMHPLKAVAEETYDMQYLLRRSVCSQRMGSYVASRTGS
jgi:hypothetical protein